MPVCARCEGELIGILAALIAIWFFRPPCWVMAVIMLMVIALVLYGGVILLEKKLIVWNEDEM